MQVNHLQTRIKIATVALILMVDAVWIVLGGFSVLVDSLALAIGLIGALMAVGTFYRRYRKMIEFETACFETALLIAFSLAAAVLSYLVTSLDFPLVDEQLTAADAALGFDWMAYVGFVNERPWLGGLSTLVYVTTLAQVSTTVVLLALSGKVAETRQFMSAVMIAALISIAISGLLPAAGALATLRPPAAFTAANAPLVDLPYKQVFFDLRDGTLRLIDLANLKGLIAFPSYHGALSVLVVLGFTAFGRWIIPVGFLNAAVLMATPVDGGHHMIDVIGGIATAYVAWKLAKAFDRVTDRTAARTRQPLEETSEGELTSRSATG